MKKTCQWNIPQMKLSKKNKTLNYRWRKRPPPEFDITFKGEEFSLPL